MKTALQLLYALLTGLSYAAMNMSPACLFIALFGVATLWSLSYRIGYRRRNFGSLR